MTPSDFLTCRNRLELSQAAMAQALGISRRQVQYYESGAWPIPLTVELACEALERRMSKKSAPNRKKPVATAQ